MIGADLVPNFKSPHLVAFWLLVAMPGAPSSASSVLAPNSDSERPHDLLLADDVRCSPRSAPIVRTTRADGLRPTASESAGGRFQWMPRLSIAAGFCLDRGPCWKNFSWLFRCLKPAFGTSIPVSRGVCVPSSEGPAT